LKLLELEKMVNGPHREEAHRPCRLPCRLPFRPETGSEKLADEKSLKPDLAFRETAMHVIMHLPLYLSMVISHRYWAEVNLPVPILHAKVFEPWHQRPKFSLICELVFFSLLIFLFCLSGFLVFWFLVFGFRALHV
jgi:hypothetical protein